MGFRGEGSPELLVSGILRRCVVGGSFGWGGRVPRLHAASCMHGSASANSKQQARFRLWQSLITGAAPAHKHCMVHLPVTAPWQMWT